MIDGRQTIRGWVEYLNQWGTCRSIEYGSDASGVTLKIDWYTVDADLAREASAIAEGILSERCGRLPWR